MLRYMDFDLKIGRKGDHYTAEVIRSPVGEASCDFKLPFSEEKLENLVLKIGYSRRKTRRIYSPEMDAVRELGGKLFEAVFSSGVHSCLKSSMNEARHQDGTGLRLRLRFQDVPELFDLPWELLLDRSVDRFLALSNQTPIVRYIEMPEPIRPITATLPLQLLVMVSSPSDYEKLDVEREKTMLQEVLAPLIKKGKIHLEWMEDATLTTLQHCLQSGKYHMFHFIGHGGFDTRTEEGVLVMEDESGRGWLAGAQRIGVLLHNHRSMRLVVLNSCEGARNSRSDPFAGVATTLVQQGILAVVAMQFEITDRAANTFSSEFYTALAKGFPVDAAVTEARMAIFAQPNDVEWGTPVLYMRSDDGVLFDLNQGATEPVAAAQKPKKPKKADTKIKEENKGRIQHDERFVLSDLTVADKKAGLMWTKDANIAKKYMTWDDAFKFIDELNKQKYAGYSDWRLPAKKEFKTLVDYAGSQGYKRDLDKHFNMTGFRNVQANVYWSSSTYALNPAYAWYVDMIDGDVYGDDKTNTNYVWPVRAGQ